MFALISQTKVIFAFAVWICLLVSAKTEETDRYSYCECCLAVAKEMEKVLKEIPNENRQNVVKKLLSGQLCKSLLSYNEDHVTSDRMKSACMHLLESHRDHFCTALAQKDTKNLDILLCYEQSHACVGVKRQFPKNSKADFTERDVEALLEKNKEHVRVVQPVHSISDEL